MNAPKNIWICAAGKDVPEWVVERMTTAEVATDGSFDIEASDGVIRVEAGFAVFEVGHDVYACAPKGIPEKRSEEHTSELQSLMRISYAVFCLKKKKEQTLRENTANT